MITDTNKSINEFSHPKRGVKLLARRVLKMKENFIRARTAILNFSSEGNQLSSNISEESKGAYRLLSTITPAKLRFLLSIIVDLTEVFLAGILPVMASSETKSSPYYLEIKKQIEIIKKLFGEVSKEIPQAILNFNTANIINNVKEITFAIEKIIVRQLPLLHREEVEDTFAGLDSCAPFPSYRCSALNRGFAASHPVQTQSIGIIPAPSSSSSQVAGVSSEIICWETKIGGLIWSSPIVGRDGCLYTGHADGEFVCLNRAGEIKWRIHDSQMMYIDSTGALSKDGYLYMASTDVDKQGHQNQGRLWKIDPKSGEIFWTFWGRHFENPANNPKAHLSSFFEGNLSLNEENGRIFIYLGSDDNWFYKVDSDGNLVWEYYTDSYPIGVIWTKPCFSPDRSIVYIGALSGYVHAVVTATGKCRWKIRVGGAVVSSIAVGKYGELFFGCFDGRIYAIAPEDGEIFWSYQTMGLVYSSPAVFPDTGELVIGSSDGGLYCINRFGEKQWVYRTDAPIKSSPAVDSEGYVYFGNQNGKLYCIDRQGRRVWSFLTAEGPENDLNCSPTIDANGAIYIGSTNGKIYGISKNYYYLKKDDPRININPNHDAEVLPIEACGAIIVFCSADGTPQFIPPENVSISSNITLQIFAADENLDIIPAEIIADTLKICITTEEQATGASALEKPDGNLQSAIFNYEFRVDSLGRFINVIPAELMRYNTKYTILVECQYISDVTRNLSTSISFKTLPCEHNRHSFLTLFPKRQECSAYQNMESVSSQETLTEIFSEIVTVKSVPGFVIKGFCLIQPKELDALAQAALDAHNFGIAPIYLDENEGIIAIAACSLIDKGGQYEFAPKSVNKFVAAGPFYNGAFRVAGSAQIIAQGANNLLNPLWLSGEFCDYNDAILTHAIGYGAVWAASPLASMPDFEELLKVMRMIDNKNDVCGLLTYRTLPFDSPALKKPDGVQVKTMLKDGEIAAEFYGKPYKKEKHWIHIELIDLKQKRVIPNIKTTIAVDHNDNVTAVSAKISDTVKNTNYAAVLVLDLFPFSVLTKIKP